MENILNQFKVTFLVIGKLVRENEILTVWIKLEWLHQFDALHLYLYLRHLLPHRLISLLIRLYWAPQIIYNFWYQLLVLLIINLFNFYQTLFKIFALGWQFILFLSERTYFLLQVFKLVLALGSLLVQGLLGRDKVIV